MVFSRNFPLALNTGACRLFIRTEVDKGWAIDVLRDGEVIKDPYRRFVLAIGGHYSLGSKAMDSQTRLYLIFAPHRPRGTIS